MSSLLIKSVRVINQTSEFHQKVVDIFVDSGKISQIGKGLEIAADEVIQKEGLSVSVGWFDLRASLCEPGLEYKDTISTLCQSASFGGFTDVATLPNTQPIIQSKESIGFVKQQSQLHTTDLHPIVAFTKEVEGKQLTEMLDLHHAGAVAFSDGTKPLQNEGILTLGLQYLQTVDGLLMVTPEVESIAPNGQMHEGISSTLLGMKGLPALSEELAIIRSLELLKYTGGKIHFSNISTARSVELIREAKKQDLRVSCDICAHQVYFTDSDMMAFDTLRKVKPPFRTEKDNEAIWEGLLDNTIDVITSSHSPHDQESKQLEFDLADFGILGLETAFATINSKRPKNFPIEKLIEKFTTNPRQILKLSQPKI
ncbi:MAG: dihydroorotase, partial [Arenicella sp.]